MEALVVLKRGEREGFSRDENRGNKETGERRERRERKKREKRKKFGALGI